MACVTKLADSTFNAPWIDYVLEATEHKALKGSGCIIGLTLKTDALARWLLARSVTAKYSMMFHQAVCQGGHKTAQRTRHIIHLLHHKESTRTHQ